MKLVSSLLLFTIIQLGLSAQDATWKLSLQANFGIGIGVIDEILLVEPPSEFQNTFIKLQDIEIGPIAKWGIAVNTPLTKKIDLHFGTLYASESWKGEYINSRSEVDVIGLPSQSRFTLHYWEFPSGVQYQVTDQFDLGLQNSIRIFNTRQAWPDVIPQHHFKDSFFNPLLEAAYQIAINQESSLRFAFYTQWIRQNLEQAKTFSYWTYGVSMQVSL